jgi:hypothetical protein
MAWLTAVLFDQRDQIEALAVCPGVEVSWCSSIVCSRRANRKLKAHPRVSIPDELSGSAAACCARRAIVEY